MTLSFRPHHYDFDVSSYQSPVTFSVAMDQVNDLTLEQNAPWKVLVEPHNHTHIVNCDLKSESCDRVTLLNTPYIEASYYRFTVTIVDGYRLDLLNNGTFSVRDHFPPPSHTHFFRSAW